MEIIIKEQQENAIKWLEALLSGKYKQGRGLLVNEYNRYCCWGIGCMVVGIPIDTKSGWDNTLYQYIGYKNEGGYIDPVVKNGSHKYVSLALLNDNAGWTFTQIANYLIEHCETNFLPEVAEAIKKHFNEVREIS